MADEEQEKVFTVTRKIPGYAHTKIEGEFTGPVTVEDVRKKFFNTGFGGRDARIFGNKFYCTRHDD